MAPSGVQGCRGGRSTLGTGEQIPEPGREAMAVPWQGCHSTAEGDLWSGHGTQARLGTPVGLLIEQQPPIPAGTRTAALRLSGSGVGPGHGHC